jgi:hypothetical protein
MLVERALQLIGGGEVDIAIGQIDRRAVEHPVGLKLRPLVGGEDFVGGGGVVGHGLGVLPFALCAAISASICAIRIRSGESLGNPFNRAVAHRLRRSDSSALR